MKGLLSFVFLFLISFKSFAVEATHGMVLFGQEKLMAYHLPMFHKIHAKQVVLEYTLSEELKKKLLSYSEGNKLLTFVPAPFDLEAFLLKPHPLTGDVYLGHFEKDGEMVMEGVTLLNVKILYQRGLVKPQGTLNHYAFFGTPSDLYEVHLLDGGLPVDHIAKASIDTTNVSNVSLAHSALNSFTKTESTDLLNDKDVSVVELYYEIPCRRRLCDTITKKLEVTTEKTYFKDDVM